MTVGAVSGISYVYTSNYQTEYFSSSISESRLNDLMKQYGVLQTGNQDTDMKALFQAMYNYYSQSAAATAKSPANPTGPSQAQLAANAPWAPLMMRIGLSATGNLSNDYSAFMSKIHAMEAGTKSSGEKQSLTRLEQQASSFFVQPQSSPQAEQAPAKASGADIKVMVNRAYMLS